jgi:magnesium chelatase family protein
MVGVPGAGKTMLARRLPSILPPLSREEALEVTKIYSIAGLLRRGSGLIEQRPFRSPHHTTSSVAMIGGGSVPRPGEVTLSHRGILFWMNCRNSAKQLWKSCASPWKMDMFPYRGYMHH